MEPLGQTEERGRSKTGFDQGAFEAIERVREIADHLRASDQRIRDLEAGLQAMRERTQRELRAAVEHTEQAEARAAAEAARADAAERRASKLRTGSLISWPSFKMSLQAGPGGEPWQRRRLTCWLQPQLVWCRFKLPGTTV